MDSMKVHSHECPYLFNFSPFSLAMVSISDPSKQFHLPSLLHSLTPNSFFINLLRKPRNLPLMCHTSFKSMPPHNHTSLSSQTMMFMIAWPIEFVNKELHFILQLENAPCSVKAIKVREQTHLGSVVKMEGADLYKRLIPFGKLQIIKGLELDQCGMIINARNLFEEMPEKKLISWNTSIAKLVDFEDYLESSKSFLLIRDDFPINGSRIFTMLIWASAKLRLNSIERHLHLCAWKMNIDEDIIVSCGALIDMFNKCGSIEDAQWVFEDVPKKTIVGWNSIIAVCVLHGYNEEEIEVIVSNELELLAIQTCHIMNYYGGNVPNQEGQNYGIILVGEYQKKLEKLEKALLDTKIAMHDGDNNVKALFHQVQAHMTLNDGATIASMLFSCSRRKLLEIGKQLQTYALRHDTLINNSFVAGALID